ncbi:MAG: DUF5681 domain-containing protein [Candidatus Poribacteria bacterium]|nr:DUF5681 domain-containing protein [Candidatus Poribacteria bacterium]
MGTTANGEPFITLTAIQGAIAGNKGRFIDMAKAKNGQRKPGSGTHPNSLANLRKWQPGQSGNPKGMDPGVGHVRELAKQHTLEAIETLVEIRGDPKQSGSARVAAANALLDRGWGRPDQSVSIDQGQSLLSILDELERRADMRVIEGEVTDNDSTQPEPIAIDNKSTITST